MNYAGVDTVIGLYQPNFVYAVDTVQRVKTGMCVTAYDNYWGYGEFIYGKASAGIAMGSICTMDNVLVSGGLELQMAQAAPVASTARPYCIAMSTFTTGQFGWFCVSGLVPVKGAALAAGASFAVNTNGAARAATATFGVQGGVVQLPATTAVAKTGCSGRSGDFNITVPNAEGWFIGCVLSGTGVGASALITNVSPDGRTVTVSVANSAAIVGGTVTATYTGFVVAQISRPAGLGL